MGETRVVHLIIGRLCTPDEIDALWAQLQEMPNKEEIAYEALHSIPCATSAMSAHSALSLLGSDGVTRFPVVLNLCGWHCANAAATAAYRSDEFTWYVVERIVYYESDLCGASTDEPMDFMQWERPRDPRHGLLLVHDLI